MAYSWGSDAGGMALGRVVTLGALIVASIAIQSTIFPHITLLGVIPQLSLVVVVSLAYLEGEKVGAATGFSTGLILDLLLPQSTVGLTALIYTLVGYGVGASRQYFPAESVWAPILAVAVATAATEIGYATLAVILGQAWISFSFTLKLSGLIVAYDTLLTPFVFPLVRNVMERFHPYRRLGG